MRIESITASDTVDIRHRVLWPDMPNKYSIVEGDEFAGHLGIYNAERLVGVASLFEDEGSVRLRKFAVDTDFQGKGFGSALLGYAIDVVRNKGASSFWCDARENAVSFYKRNGLSVVGGRFYKSEIPYFRMSINF